MQKLGLHGLHRKSLTAQAENLFWLYRYTCLTFAVISKISENGQYFVGGRDTLQLATKLIGLLAQQNQVNDKNVT